jgi:hypothetical protein
VSTEVPALTEHTLEGDLAEVSQLAGAILTNFNHFRVWHPSAQDPDPPALASPALASPAWAGSLGHLGVEAVFKGFFLPGVILRRQPPEGFR